MISVHGLSLELRVPDEWHRIPDDDHERWSHPSGLELVARFRDGARARVEVDILPAGDIAPAAAPRLSISSGHPLVPWLAGASAEVVALTPDGPVIATQRRGFAVGTPDEVSLFPEPLVVAPGHPMTSVWSIEHFPGDLLDAGVEPTWLPLRRHVPLGDEVQLDLPDGIVTGVEHVESDDGFLLMDEPGLHIAQVGGQTGISHLEVGWHLGWEELVAAARNDAPDDLWCYLTTLLRDVDVDALDVRLARALESPTLWGALAAARAVEFGISRPDDARRAADAILDGADIPTRIALLSRGLVDVDVLVGTQLGKVAYEGLVRFGLGRVMSTYPDGAERDLVAAWFWNAGLGESELGHRIGGIAALAQARALCRASETLDPEAVAWLSLFN